MSVHIKSLVGRGSSARFAGAGVRWPTTTASETISKIPGHELVRFGQKGSERGEYCDLFNDDGVGIRSIGSFDCKDDAISAWKRSIDG